LFGRFGSAFQSSQSQQSPGFLHVPSTTGSSITWSSFNSIQQNKGDLMARVLLLGYDPDFVDFSDLALPPGMTACPQGSNRAMAPWEIHFWH
jgi:hypothetical protein